MKYLKPFVAKAEMPGTVLQLVIQWKLKSYKDRMCVIEKANFRKKFYQLGLNMKVTLMSSNSLWIDAGGLAPHVPDCKDIPCDQKHSQNWSLSI